MAGKSHCDTVESIKTILSDAVFRSMAIKRYAEKACQGRNRGNVCDNFKFCCCPFKVTLGEFKKTSYISTKAFSRFLKRELRSDRVCHAHAGKIRNSFELYNFIYSSLQKNKRAAIEVSDDSSTVDASVYCQRSFRCQIKLKSSNKEI